MINYAYKKRNNIQNFIFALHSRIHFISKKYTQKNKDWSLLWENGILCDFLHVTFKNVSKFYFFLGKGLTQLDVSQNQLTKVPSNALKNLHHLLIFNVNHNRITQIHAKAFEGLDTLEILTMYENKINLVEPEAFRGLDK